tara:strand:- start:2 stop:307 length:306 start_codon:yes stop_codon:yes gene_type:complete
MKGLFESWRKYIKEGRETDGHQMPSPRGLLGPEAVSFRDEVWEKYSDEVFELAQYMEQGISNKSEAIGVLMNNPEFRLRSYSSKEIDMMWYLASEQLAQGM